MPTELSKPLFKTHRLNVFKVRIKPADHNEFHEVYLGFRHDIDQPAPAVVATIFPTSTCGNVVDWVSVHEAMRRTGLATELLKAIESRVGELHMDGATTEGDAFCEKWYAAK